MGNAYPDLNDADKAQVLAKIQESFLFGSATEEETQDSIRQCYYQNNYLFLLLVLSHKRSLPLCQLYLFETYNSS